MPRILVLALLCITGINSQVCPLNEHYTQCGPTCEPSCARPEPRKCLEECILPGCRCKPGFFRNSAGMCVTDCSMEPCGKNMQRVQCGSPEECEPVCTGKKPMICTPKCVVNACQCKPGYIRDSVGGACISMRLCNVKRSKLPATANTQPQNPTVTNIVLEAYPVNGNNYLLRNKENGQNLYLVNRNVQRPQ